MKELIEVYCVRIADTDEIVADGFDTMREAYEFIDSQQHPKSLYVGWHYEYAE